MTSSPLANQTLRSCSCISLGAALLVNSAGPGTVYHGTLCQGEIQIGAKLLEPLLIYAAAGLSFDRWPNSGLATFAVCWRQYR